MTRRNFNITATIIIIIAALSVAIIAWIGTRPDVSNITLAPEKNPNTVQFTEQSNSAGANSECGITDQLYVAAELHHDRDTDPAQDSASVFLGDTANPEFPIKCDAEVTISGSGLDVKLTSLGQGRYQAGEGQPFAGAFVSAVPYELKIDLLADGSIDAIGEVTLGLVEPEDMTAAVSLQQANFTWVDGGDTDNTRTYLQVSDQRDFLGGQFKPGCSEGIGALLPSSSCMTPNGTISLGGSSMFQFFEEEFSTLYVRWQTETNGTLAGAEGRLVGWMRYDDAARCWSPGSSDATCQL